MKYLLVLTVVLVGVWIWRNNRRAERADAAPPAPRQPHRMVACKLCGTHVPESEQLAGQRGVYCCAEHRRQAESPAG